MSLNIPSRSMLAKALLVLVAACSASSVLAASIGRVLAVVGQFEVQREGKTLPLAAGAELFVGDDLTTATGSQAQIRFNDGAIVALRPDTRFRVDAYAFKQPDQKEKGFFSLVKGGFRTVTGLLGKSDPLAYKVTTPTATVGIRGTNYLVRMCEKDCQQDDGSAAASGLYGGVAEGRIAVGNEAGTSEVGGGEYFYVADIKSLPMPLLTPPSFMREKPLAIGKGKSDGATGARATPAPQAVAMSGSNAVAAQVTGLTTLRPADLSTASSTLGHTSPPVDNGGGFVDIGGSGTIRGQVIWMTNADLDLHLITPGGTAVYFGNPSVTLPGGAVAQIDHDNMGGTIDIAPDQRVENIVVNGTNIQAGTYTYYVYSFYGNNGGAATTAVVRISGGDGVTSQYSVTLASQEKSPNYLVNYTGGSASSSSYAAAWAHAGTSPSTYTNSSTASAFSDTTSLTASTVQTFGGSAGSVSRNGSSLVDSGSSAEAGNVSWGRWSSGLASYPSSHTPEGGIHIAIGDATPASAIPVTGEVAYSRVGGTLPTDSGGNVGTWNGGSLVLNFTNRSMATGTPLSWSVGGAEYSASFSGVPVGSGSNTVLTNAGTCSGGGCGTGASIDSLNLNGTLVGSSAQGTILSITSQTSAATFPTTSSVQAFKR